MQRLGSFRFDPAALTLLRAGSVVRASRKTMELLALLARAPGEVVSHAELRAHLWPEAPVEERNLGQQVYLLRGVFAVDPEVRVENVPRRGYRLSVPDEPAHCEPPAPPKPPRPGLRLPFIRIALAAAFALVFASVRGPALHARPAVLAPEAAKAYERGRLMWERRDLGSLKIAERYFKRTLALAPDDSRGFAGLAAVEAIRGNLAHDKRGEHAAFGRAQQFAAAALARDPDCADALAVEALVLDLESHDLKGAEALFRRAQGLDPQNAYAHVWLGVALFDAGRLREARRELARGEQLAPGSKTAARWLGYALFDSHALEAAAQQFRSALEIDPSDEDTLIGLAGIDEARQDYGRALARLAHWGGLIPRDKRLTVIARLDALRGRRADARRELARVRRATDVDPLELAATQLALGRPADALASLRRGERMDLSSLRRDLAWDPRFAALRRFAGERALPQRVN